MGREFESHPCHNITFLEPNLVGHFCPFRCFLPHAEPNEGSKGGVTGQRLIVGSRPRIAPLHRSSTRAPTLHEMTVGKRRGVFAAPSVFRSSRSARLHPLHPAGALPGTWESFCCGTASPVLPRPPERRAGQGDVRSFGAPEVGTDPGGSRMLRGKKRVRGRVIPDTRWRAGDHLSASRPEMDGNRRNFPTSSHCRDYSGL